MSEETNWVLESIEPKSDQLNADDMLTGPITVTVTDVKKGITKEQPIVVEIDGGFKPYKPCKSMRRVLILMWGDKPKEWIGKRLCLFCDPSVMFGGAKVGGIRIKSMSGITASTSILLTATRGRKAEFKIESLGDDELAERVGKAVKAIDACESLDKLGRLKLSMKQLFKDCNTNQLSTIEAAIRSAKDRLGMAPE